VSLKRRLTKLAKSLRRNATDTERLLWQELRNKQLEGFKFRRQQSIGNYIVDFVNFENLVIIELDGRPHAILRNKDRNRDAWFQSQGFRVLRF
jgi:very-short-patch-repair endonuclease